MQWQADWSNFREFSDFAACRTRNLQLAAVGHGHVGKPNGVRDYFVASIRHASMDINCFSVPYTLKLLLGYLADKFIVCGFATRYLINEDANPFRTGDLAALARELDALSSA